MSVRETIETNEGATIINGDIPMLDHTFNSDDLRNADAGRSFVKEITEEEKWVRPWYNVDLESYLKVRGDNLNYQAISNDKNLQFTMNLIEAPPEPRITVVNFSSSDPEIEEIFDTVSAAAAYIRAGQNTYGYKITMENVQELQMGAFGGCAKLKQAILPDTLQLIGSGAFASSGLINITIPNSVITIGDSAFAGCRSLATIILNEGLANLNRAFMAETIATELTVPSTINSINAEAFIGAYSLRTIVIEKEQDSIEGAPWGLPNGTVVWQS